MSSKPKKLVKSAGAEKPGIVARLTKYFEELKFEWVKITFPTKKELTQSTIVVFLFTIILMTILSAYDMAMSFLFNNWILLPLAQ